LFPPGARGSRSQRAHILLPLDGHAKSVDRDDS